MYYYAILNDDDICTEIYAMPVQISGDKVISISSNDQSIIGQRYNRVGAYFEPLYYYAVLNEKGIVTETVYRDTQEQATDTFRAITFAQYQTVKGLYWNGTEYITPPISIAAVASTDEVNYKDQDKWLSEKLDEMEADISANESDISTLSTDVSTIVSSLSTVTQNLAALATVVDGKANAVHEHAVADVAGLTVTLDGFSADIGELETAVSGKANASHNHEAADLSGVVKTVNGNAPDESGNIVVTSGGMTPEEILSAIETVDGTGSGLDADTLDGLHAASFAAANHFHDADYAPFDHTHAQYLTGEDIDAFEFVTGDEMTDALAGKAEVNHNHDASYAAIGHTHSDYATTSAVNTALAGKSDTTHNHDTVYAPIAHSHAMENVSGLVTALAGKSGIDHNHNTAYAAISHSHDIENISGLPTALANKADSTHNHDNAYAGINHTHDGYAASDHTHTGYATTASVTALENDISGKAEVSHSHSQNDVIGLTAALNGKANTSHSHAIGDVTGLQTALNGKAASSHTHSDYLPTSGGTVNGNINVNGLVRINNQQSLYDSGSMITLSTNNRETMIAGSKIYSKVAISTSSDARLKENVQPAPVDDLINMIKGLEIKKFNYIGNTEKNIGVIAQDFMYNNPTYISEFFIRQCCDDGMYSFKDTELVYALAAAVQDIYNRIENNN